MGIFSQNLSKKYYLTQITFGLHAINAIIHVILTNLPGNAYTITKVLLMPFLCGFFLVTVKDLKKGWYIPWALCGLWLGNICLIWGEQSPLLFFFGSAFTIIGLFGYIWIFMRPVKNLSIWFVFLQMPIIWCCVFFVLFMKDDLNRNHQHDEPCSSSYSRSLIRRLAHVYRNSILYCRKWIIYCRSLHGKLYFWG